MVSRARRRVWIVRHRHIGGVWSYAPRDTGGLDPKRSVPRRAALEFPNREIAVAFCSILNELLRDAAPADMTAKAANEAYKAHIWVVREEYSKV